MPLNNSLREKFWKIDEMLRRSISLRFRLTALVLVVSVCALVVVTAFIGTQTATVIERNAEEQLGVANRTLSSIVSVWLESQLSALRNLVSLPDTISMNAERQKPVLQNMALAYPYMYLISTTNLKGINRARSDNEKPKNYADRNWFRMARNGEPLVFESLIGKTSGKPALVVSMPIKDKGGRIVGVGMFASGLDKLDEQVHTTRVGKTGYAYLIDQRNRVIAHPDPAYDKELVDLSVYPPVAAFRQGARGLISFIDKSGIKWDAYVNQLGYGWGIIVQQQNDELLETRRTFQKVALVSILVAVLGLMVATWWVTRRALHPIEDLTETVTRFAINKLGLSAPGKPDPSATPVHNRDEVAALSKSFSEMIVRLDLTMTRLEQELAERRRAEETLRDSEEKFRTLVNNINIAVYRTLPDGRYIQVNPTMAKIFGYDTPEQMMETSVGDIYQDPEDRKLFLEELRIKGTVKDVEIPMKKRDGAPIWTSSSVTVQNDEAGCIKWVDGVLEDITERRTAVDALLDSEKKLTSIVYGSPIPQFVVDRNHTVIYWNKALEEMSGIKAAEVIGTNQHWRAFYSKEQQTLADLLTDGHAERIPELQAEKYHKSFLVPDAYEVTDFMPHLGKWVHFTAAAIKDSRGQIIGAIETLVDITERKRAEETARQLNEELELKVRDRTKELYEANLKLQEMDHLKSMFLANMSHEIRTPMNGIIGMADLLMETSLDKEQREFVRAVKSSADALLTIVNDILDFSKIEAQKLDLEAMCFNLRDSVGDILHTLTFRAAGKGLEIICDIPPSVPDRVIGDPGRLRQIIINLVGNAIKFTDKGEVVLSIIPEWIKEQEASLHFVVTDTGIGIPREKQDRIFEAFSQADASTTRKYGGTGLGLTISARLVEIMGGRIWVESEPGQGSAFHFTILLGLQKDAAVRHIPEKLENLQDLPVLVVDDSATNRRILAEMLKHWRMDPVTVDSGAAALEMLATVKQRGTPFRFMILDVNMPNMSGFELANRIRQNPDNQNLAIMVLTSSGQRGDAARCRELGISAYLTKPTKQSSLLDAIMTVLGKTEPAGARPALVTQHVLREKNRRLRILLAEDNAVNQKIASSMLTKRGHTVVVAGNGKEVLADLEAKDGHLFDLILMDVQMPDMDGLEATAAIRQKEKKTGAHIPIIALTAHAMKGDREMCLDVGMDAYVSKPIRAEELFKTIDELFST